MAQHLSHGADVERLDDIALALRRQSEAVGEIGGRGATMVERLRAVWQGPDLEEFAAEWRAARRTIEAAQAQLSLYGRRAAVASELQRSASGGSSGAGDLPAQARNRPGAGELSGELARAGAVFLPTVPLAVPPRVEGEPIGPGPWAGPAFERLDPGVYPSAGPSEPLDSRIPGERGVAFDPTQASRVAPLRPGSEHGGWLHVHED